jgi:hypothetical protein
MTDLNKQITNMLMESYDRGVADALAAAEEAVQKVVNAAVEAEREACAQLALHGTGEAVQTRTLEILQSERQRIAASIRARGEK